MTRREIESRLQISAVAYPGHEPRVARLVPTGTHRAMPYRARRTETAESPLFPAMASILQQTPRPPVHPFRRTKRVEPWSNRKPEIGVIGKRATRLERVDRLRDDSRKVGGKRGWICSTMARLERLEAVASEERFSRRAEEGMAAGVVASLKVRARKLPPLLAPV